MKSLVFTLLFCFSLLQLYAQPRLGIYAKQITYDKDSSRWNIGDTITASYYIYNAGNTIYVAKPNDTVLTRLRITSNGVSRLVLSPTPYQLIDTLRPGNLLDKQKVTFSFPIDSNYFKKGYNVVVVWPESEHISTKDTSTPTKVMVYDPSGISLQKNHPLYVRFYPNPSNGILHIDRSQQAPKIRELWLVDISGKEVLRLSSQADQIDVSTLPVGTYMLNVCFANGITDQYKMLISR